MTDPMFAPALNNPERPEGRAFPPKYLHHCGAFSHTLGKLANAQPTGIVTWLQLAIIMRREAFNVIYTQGKSCVLTLTMNRS
jgi:hypothetical protein